MGLPGLKGRYSSAGLRYCLEALQACHFLAFELLELACIPRLTAPSPIFKATSIASSNLSLTLTFSLPPPHFGDLRDYLGPIWKFEDNLPIARSAEEQP